MLWYQLFLLFWFLFLDISGIMRHVLISPLVRDVWTLPCKHCKPCKACEQAPARAKSHVCEALPGAQLGRNLKVGFLDDLDDDKQISFGNAVSDIIDYSRLIIWWFSWYCIIFIILFKCKGSSKIMWIKNGGICNILLFGCGVVYWNHHNGTTPAHMHVLTYYIHIQYTLINTVHTYAYTVDICVYIYIFVCKCI